MPAGIRNGETLLRYISELREGERIQDIYENDPYLDGREKDTEIDEDSPCIEGKDGWTVVKGQGAYGKTYLRYDGDPAQNHLVYRIPEKLDGKYAVYAFQQRDGCAVTTFEIDAAGKKTTVPFNRADLVLLEAP